MFRSARLLNPRLPLGAFALSALTLALAGCATAPAADGPPAGDRDSHRDARSRDAASARRQTRRAGCRGRPARLRRTAAAAPGQPRPFAEVIKEAKESQGLFPIWQKDDKVWIEIAPDQFGVPYLFTVEPEPRRRRARCLRRHDADGRHRRVEEASATPSS